jgi:hypothetical protein
MQSLWVRFEPIAAAATHLRATLKPGRGALATKDAAFDEAFAELAQAQIAQVAEIIDLLETYAVAEVELTSSAHEIEDLGFVGYELWIDLDVALHEVSPEPHEMFAALYALLSIGKEGGLYDVEITAEEEAVSIDALLSEIIGRARQVGVELDPDAPSKEPASALSKAERFFLSEAQLSWPADAAAIKKAWKQLAARFHPDKTGGDPLAAQKFHVVREAYDLLLARR